MFGKKKHPETINVNITEEIVIIENEYHHFQKVDLILSGIKYNSLTIKNSIIMALSLNVNDVVSSTLGLVDHATQQPITSATFANQSYSSDTEGVATVDASGNVTGIAPGTANLTFTADVTYTGNDGQQHTETGKTLVVAVTVSAVPQTTDLVVTFSAPTQKTA